MVAADRELTRQRIDALTREFTSVVDAARDSSTDDEHDPEGATTAFERSQTSALLAAAEQHLADLDHALARIRDGSYEQCADCGSSIPDERLRARPAARTCVACAGGSVSPSRGRAGRRR